MPTTKPQVSHKFATVNTLTSYSTFAFHKDANPPLLSSFYCFFFGFWGLLQLTFQHNLSFGVLSLVNKHWYRSRHSLSYSGGSPDVYFDWGSVLVTSTNKFNSSYVHSHCCLMKKNMNGMMMMMMMMFSWKVQKSETRMRRSAGVYF